MSENIHKIKIDSNAGEMKWTYDNISINLNKNENQNPFNIEALPKFKEDNNICSFTHRNVEDERSIFKKIQLIIQEAKKTQSYLILASFVIRNTEIFQLIEDSLEILRGKVYIIVGNKFNTFDSYDYQNEYHNMGLSNLVHQGAQIRFVSNAHLKFISTKNASLICTTNFTTEGLFRNPEFGLYLMDTEIAIQLNRLFFTLWFDHSNAILINDEWIRCPSQNQTVFPFKKIKKNIQPKLIISSPKKMAEINKNQQIISPTTLISTIIKLLQSAKKSIYISVYLFKNTTTMLKKIEKLLIEKHKAGISDIKILIPSVKISITRQMKAFMESLSKKGIQVKYYREVHGKCLIIDKTRVLIFTGNFDTYLDNDDSCDIGYVISNQSTVQNYCLLYEHLWKEAADTFDLNVKMDLQLDLVIHSYELVSSRVRISVSVLKQQISYARSIQFFFHASGNLLKITTNSGRVINIDFVAKNQDEMVDQGGYMIVEGIMRKNSKMIMKEASVLSVAKLDLKLIWQL